MVVLLTIMPCTACNSPHDWGFDRRVMDEREKLRQHFLALSPDEQVDGWDTLWEQQLTPWDRNQPNPALVETLETKGYLTESPFKQVEGRRVRKKVLVPGCGGGYDVLLFASYGFDAYVSRIEERTARTRR